jgi:thioredoxin 1
MPVIERHAVFPEETMLRKWFVFLACALLTAAAAATGLPYDDQADARADVARALAQAHATGKQVLLVFGANWCPDCREFDKAMHGRSAALTAEKFIVVKIDVGQFDRNIDLAKEYGNPIKKGIPAAVLLTAGNRVLYATTGGELADARRMGETGIDDFLNDMAARHH